MNNKKKESASSSWIDEERVKELKRTVSLELVLSQYGQLEGLNRKGSRLVGRSPFRDDKNPSFSVDLERNLWNDFGGRPVVDGTEVSGDVFGLVQAIKGCSFREALLELHEFSGGAPSPSPEQRVETKREQVDRTLRKPRRPEATANVPFGRELKGRTNIPPLIERGISESTIKKFGVVYCSAGLMKGRIAFPVRNAGGEIMAYAGRAVKKTDEEENGKYKFPPRFNKLHELYNVDRVAGDKETKKAVKDFGLIVVEGFTDVMKLDQEGFPNVVALMGSVMSEQQKKILLDPKLNPTRRLTLFLDNDEAGQQAKRKIAGETIYDGFVRYVDWSRATKGKTEPEHFEKTELVELLSLG